MSTCPLSVLFMPSDDGSVAPDVSPLVGGCGAGSLIVIRVSCDAPGGGCDDECIYTDGFCPWGMIGFLHD